MSLLDHGRGAAGASLLERIAAASPEGAAAEGAGSQLESILRNLRHILNTRQGSAPAQMDLGTLAPTDALDAHHSMVDSLQRSLRQVIARYEPRIRDVEVRWLRMPNEGFHLHFEVTARLSSRPERIAFRTLVDAAGRVVLRG